MKLVIISLSVFWILELIYAPWGDYYSDYWNVAYYVVNYFWATWALWFIHLHAKDKVSQYMTMLFVIYFSVLFIWHIICLFSSAESEMIYANGVLREEIRLNLYQKSIPDKSYFNVGTIILTIGILYIRFKLKKPCQKNLGQNSFG